MKRVAFVSAVALTLSGMFVADLLSQHGGATEVAPKRRVQGRLERAEPEEGDREKMLLELQNVLRRAVEEQARKTGRPPGQVPMMGLLPMKGDALVPMMGSSLGAPYGEVYREPSQVHEELRQRLRSLVDENSKLMSADELREAIRAMQQLTVEAEFIPIIEQLQAITERGTAESGEKSESGTALDVYAREQSLAARKASLAVQLLKTSDLRTVIAVEEALSRDSRKAHVD